jgi:hypothetical protein
MNTLEPVLNFFESHGGPSALVRDADHLVEDEDGEEAGRPQYACRWCLLGAIWSVETEESKRAPLEEELYRRLLPQVSPTRWLRDNHSWEKVQALLAQNDVEESK